MPGYVLTCCSTADMPNEYFQKRDIPFVCFHYNMDGEEYPDDLGQTMSYEEFYARIAAGAMPTTSQVNVGQFMDFFEPFLAEGKDIIHVSLSSADIGGLRLGLYCQRRIVGEISGENDPDCGFSGRFLRLRSFNGSCCRFAG